MFGLFNPAEAGTLTAGSVINTIGDLASKLATASSNLKPGSLTTITSVARVEPLCVLDADCVNLDYIPEVLQSTQSLFTGIWLQALSLTCDIGNVTAAKVLDPLNPNRKPDAARFIGSLAQEAWKLANESYKWRLPTTTNKLAMEAEVDQVGIKIDDKSVASVSDLANLSVGKMVNVTITNNGQSAQIPVAIRLLVNQLPHSALMSLFGIGSEDHSFTERYYKWRAGRIEFIRDLILARDLIKERKKVLSEDTEGTTTEIMRRARANKMAAFTSKAPSLASATNIIVISEATAEEVHRKHNVDLKNYASRQKFFENTYAMLLVVIDRQYERINFYTYDLHSPTSVGVRDLKVANKGSGPDLADILSAYRKGESPSL